MPGKNAKPLHLVERTHRDVYILTAIRTVSRFRGEPNFEDTALTAAMVAGRFYNTLGLTPVFDEDWKTREQRFSDNLRVFSPSEFAHIQRALELIDAERAAAEARKAAGQARRVETLSRRKMGAA